MRLENLQMLKLDIPNNIFEQMLAQAKSEVPIEACGILAGKDGKVEKFRGDLEGLLRQKTSFQDSVDSPPINAER